MAPHETLSPVVKTARINSVDVIRGVALLGILLMNITEFGLSNAYSDPSVSGGDTGWNLRVWWFCSMLFEGTMRGMFSMLFGAGIVLFTNRSNDSISGVSVTDAYFRRLMWLFLFGLIHAYLLLWEGEILYAYSILGMFAFSFRHWQPKYLVMGAIFLLVCATALDIKSHVKLTEKHDKAMVAEAKKAKGEKLLKEDSVSIEKWKEILDKHRPSKEKIAEDIAERHKGYFSILNYKSPIIQFMETTILYRIFFWDILSMMLLGMAFLKNGILRAAKSQEYYIGMIVIGYGIGLMVNHFETDYLIASHFGMLESSKTEISYNVGRVFMMMGHIGLIMLFIRSGFLMFLQKALAAVGQMAFTNYIMQTIICNIIFLGFGFGLFGMLQRYQLYYIVGGVWLLQLIVSPIWLKYFRFGPLEWCWRSLTYWERQKFKV